MKKIILYLSVLAVVCLLGSCRKEAPGYRIGVSQCSDDDWRLLMNEEIEREMMFHPDASVEIRSASDSNEKQIADIRYFIDNDFDIIIAAPNEADALTPVIKEAYEKGKPVLIFDRNINGNSYTAFQGADNKEVGRKAAMAADRLLPGGGTVIELTGLSGSTPAKERHDGFVDQLKLYPGLEIIESETALWNYEDALRVSDSLLAIHPDVSLIYAHNDRMALGAAEAAKKRGLDPKIIGVDGAAHIGMKGVEEGDIDVTFIYPTEGHQLVRTALAILKGEKYDENLIIPIPSAVEKSNVDLLLMQNEMLKEETARMKDLRQEMDRYWNQHTSQTALLYSAIAILLLVCVVLFLVLRTYWAHRRHRQELLEKNRLLEEQRDLEKQLNLQLAAATQSKLTFFTNVSHDLRTPLTLIAEPVEQLASASNLTEKQKVLMRIADKNVNILKRLINQILDFRKFENGKLDVNLEEVNAAKLALDWTDAFKALAHSRHIDFIVDISVPEGFTLALDVEKTERVVFNLLSNAFKFTPAKGVITFSMTLEENSLKIMVKDTGRGISAENLKNIFTRFYQVDKIRPEGSGIGLSLAKTFVEVQDGTLTAESEEGAGTTFTVTLPVRHVEAAASEETMAASAMNARNVAHLLDDVEETPLLESVDADDSRPLMLVIDDNEDVRLMIKALLENEFQIIQAPGGKEGIRLASRFVPDLIICDVMMPGIDGLEVCRRLKEEITTSHIPVLMLTACSLDEQRAQSYESGADGYMSKPFNSEVLKARTHSLISNRKRIKHLYSNSLPKTAENKENSDRKTPRADVENEFYARFLKIVDDQLSNPDLNVDALAAQLGLGRSQFYRKIKALTNFSPVELLRNIRLKKARDLITTTDKTISEIAYEVGFSNPAYFTKCYREVYSETPSALRERLH